MVEELYLYFWMNHLYRNLEVNTLKGPAPASAMGGSATMATAQGFYQLAEDEAVIVEWDPADALLSSISLCDWWFQPIEAHRLQSSLSSGRAASNPDGTITVVLATRDPGIVNWLDSNGLRDIFLNARWQGLPPQYPRQGPRLAAKVVKHAQLGAHLPKNIAKCSPEERQRRNTERLAAYTRRTGDLKSTFVNFD
jgi:hypothetical protein